MQLQVFPTAGLLQRTVRCCFSATVTEAEETLHLYPFTDHVLLLVAPGSELLLHAPDQPDISIRSSCLFGHHETFKFCTPTKGSHFYGIQFRPAGIHAITGMNMGLTNGTVYPIDEIIPNWRPKWIDFDECKRLLMHVIEDKLQSSTPEVMLMNEMIDFIEASDANCTVQQICNRFPISTRTLERHFKMMTGYSPKTFIRITRFHRLMCLLTLLPNVSFADVLLKVGYVDVSHFLKDCRTFTGIAFHEKMNSGVFLRSQFHFQTLLYSELA